MFRVIRFAESKLEAASHEDPEDPGVLKRVLVKASAGLSGNLQMLNWAELKPLRAFNAHYHEDMSEVFHIISGQAVMVCEGERVELEQGDTAIVPPKARHQMRNETDQSVLYIVVGISSGEGGKTVNVPDFFGDRK